MKEKKMTKGGKILLILLFFIVIGYCLFSFTSVFDRFIVKQPEDDQFVGTWDQYEVMRDEWEALPGLWIGKFEIHDDGTAIHCLYDPQMKFDKNNKEVCLYEKYLWEKIDDNAIAFIDKKHLTSSCCILKNGLLYMYNYNIFTKEIGEQVDENGYVKTE